MTPRRFLTLILLAAWLVSCAGPQSSSSTPQRQPLKVAWSLWSGWYPIIIAQELDLFAKHGAAIEPVFYESYPSSVFPDFASGQVDGMLAGLYEVLKANIPAARVVMITDNSDGAEGIVVAPEIHTPADLAGKRVGTQGAIGEFITITLLRTNGLSPNDVLMVDVAPEQVLEQLPDKIQAGYTWDPYLSQAKAQGYHILYTTADTPGMVPDVVVFHGSVLQQRPEDVRGFIAAWFEAQEYWLAHPAEGNAIIARVTGLKAEEISLTGCKLFNRQDNLNAFTPGYDTTSLYFTGRMQIEFSISMGDLTTAPDLNQVLDASFLK